MKLVVTIDTEEEFDWTAPFSSERTSVSHFSQMHRLQAVFDQCQVRPTYVIDYPVATQSTSLNVLKGFIEQGNCEIGAHIHPWVNPPLREEVTPSNSFLSNLPLELQIEKLNTLTHAINENLGVSPTTFKAGRYGFDFRLADELAKLGYTADTSVLAYTDMSRESGPDFSSFGNRPFWIDYGNIPILELPCSVGFSRRPHSFWNWVHNTLSSSVITSRVRLIGVLWHLRILRRAGLTPEGTAAPDAINVMKAMARGNAELVHISLHSPSIEPGHTPYVNNPAELDQFLDGLRTMLEFATSELSATPMTAQEFVAWYRQNRD